MTNPRQLCIADGKKKPIPWDGLRKLADKSGMDVSSYAKLVLINHCKGK